MQHKFAQSQIFVYVNRDTIVLSFNIFAVLVPNKCITKLISVDLSVDWVLPNACRFRKMLLCELVSRSIISYTVRMRMHWIGAFAANVIIISKVHRNAAVSSKSSHRNIAISQVKFFETMILIREQDDRSATGSLRCLRNFIHLIIRCVLCSRVLVKCVDT